jgi:hypothetical protein
MRCGPGATLGWQIVTKLHNSGARESLLISAIFCRCDSMMRSPGPACEARVSALSASPASGASFLKAAAAIIPMVGPQTRVLTLQNGIDGVEILSPVVPRGQVVGGTTYISSFLEEPGVIRQASRLGLKD